MLYIVLFYLSKSIYGMQINIKILGDKVFHCVFREEFLKLTIQLCCKCFIVRYDQGWLKAPLTRQRPSAYGSVSPSMLPATVLPAPKYMF